MREIKFRGWNGSAMEYGGFSLHCSAGKVLPAEGFTSMKEGDPVMQYTGIKDKYGNHIYEGDIVSFSYGIPPCSVKARIEFLEGAFYAITDKHNPPICCIGELSGHVGEFEVVGNIYQNPELLEQG